MSVEPNRSQAIEYQSPLRGGTKRVGPRPETLLYFALGSALAPAMVGVIALVGYWLTENNSFVLLGLLSLVLGAVGLIAGLGLSIAPIIDARRRGSPLYRRGLIVVLIVLACVPLAGVCVFVGNYLMDHPRCRFVLTNAGTRNVDHVIVHFGSLDESVGRLAPGASETFRLRLNGSGRIVVDFTANGKTTSSEIRDFADTDSLPKGSVVRLQIDDNGVVEK
jgi:hypothetical protein